MTQSIAAGSQALASGRRPIRFALIAGALALAFLTSACDKCGDWAWERGSKTCHDESQLK
jgi:hypothetical protein